MSQSRSVILHVKPTRWANAICPSCRARLLPRIQTRWKSYYDWSPMTHNKKWRTERKALERQANKSQELEHIGTVLTTLGVYSFNSNSGVVFVKAMASVNSFEQFNKLCNDLGIALFEIPSFARWLLHYKEGQFSQAARKMLFYASEAGDPAATLLIVAYAYEGGNLNRPEFRDPLRRLKKIVETVQDQRAMIQQALILIHYGDVEGGQKVLEAATLVESRNPFSKIFGPSDNLVVKRMSNFSQDPLEHLDSARAWRELAIVRLNTGEYSGAMEAFRKAALELDDPSAYSYLASDEEHNGRKYSSKWVEYSIKAASGGHAESAYALAKMYSLPRRQIPKEVKDESVRRDIHNPSRRVEIGLNLIFRWWRSAKTLRPARWGTEENRVEWALDWFLVGMYRKHPDTRFERAKLRWSLGTDPDLFGAVGDLLLMGTEGRGFFENSPNMMARIQAQLREWTATERGLKALKNVKENGQIPIPTSLAKLIQLEEASPQG